MGNGDEWGLNFINLKMAHGVSMKELPVNHHEYVIFLGMIEVYDKSPSLSDQKRTKSNH